MTWHNMADTSNSVIFRHTILASFNSLFIASLYICLIIGCKNSRARNYGSFYRLVTYKKIWIVCRMTLIPLIRFDDWQSQLIAYRPRLLVAWAVRFQLPFCIYAGVGKPFALCDRSLSITNVLILIFLAIFVCSPGFQVEVIQGLCIPIS